tara:strand:- start:834 stop:1055 length:222 start_codon:yes stop_codon:yes gene_type:complete
MKSKFIRQTPLFTERPRYKSIGYARQSTNRKISIHSQVDALKKGIHVSTTDEMVDTRQFGNLGPSIVGLLSGL